MSQYETRRIQREAFKMEVTEAIRAHCSALSDIAEQKYEAAARAAGEQYQAFTDVLTFLSAQTDQSRQRTLDVSISIAVQCGYAPMLERLVPLIDDPTVKGSLDECIAAAKVGRKPDTTRYKRAVPETPSGRYRLL